MADRRNYAVVTAAYWGFTVTDGALRMLVLLHFHALGYKPLDLAFLFLLYEAMGVVTNLLGGWIGSRFGLRSTLFAGLGIQIGALVMLAGLPDGLAVSLSVAYVMAAQALSGVAKDLTKMSSKSAVKLVVPDDNQGLLFKWIAILTGSKNALKGFGFFVGGYLLYHLGFKGALFAMASVLVVILVAAVFSLTSDLGKAKGKIRGRDIFSKSRDINYLSAARIFLFASRDVWFVVGVPVFLAEVAGWNVEQIGSFMALWVIGYGIVQAFVPKLLRRIRNSESAAAAAKLWGVALGLVSAIIGFGMSDFGGQTIGQALGTFDASTFLVRGLIVFGVVFAVNSALHSYLVVAYSGADKVALNVGFYYMANAWGRLTGTLLSGLVYQFYGLVACLAVSGAMVFVAVLFTVPLAGKATANTEKGASHG